MDILYVNHALAIYGSNLYYLISILTSYIKVTLTKVSSKGSLAKTGLLGLLSISAVAQRLACWGY